MTNTEIRIKYSPNTGNVPLSLANGELAINTVDGKLFYSEPSGNLKYFSVNTNPSGLDKEIQFNDSGVLGSSSNLTFDKTEGLLSVGSFLTKSHLEISDVVRQDSFNVTTNSTNTTPIVVFSASNYGTGKFLIQATSDTNRQVSELLLTHDGVTPYATEYAAIRTNNNLFNLEVDSSGGNIRLLITSTSSNTTTYKIFSTLLSSWNK